MVLSSCNEVVDPINHCYILPNAHLIYPLSLIAITLLNRDGDLHQVMTVGEVDQALANRARADQDLANRGRVDHQVLQEIGLVITGCKSSLQFVLILGILRSFPLTYMLFAFKTLTDGSLTHPVNRERVAVVNQARAVAESRARVVDHHLLREIGGDGVRYFSFFDYYPSSIYIDPTHTHTIPSFIIPYYVQSS